MSADTQVGQIEPISSTRSGTIATGLVARIAVATFGADAAVIAFSIWLGCQIRWHWGVWGEGSTDLHHLCLVYGPGIAAVWLLWLAMRGSYSAKYSAAGGEEFARVINATFLAAGTVAMVCYLIKFDLSRGFVITTFLIGTAFLPLERYTLRRLVHHLYRSGTLQRRVLAVGDVDSVHEVARVLQRSDHAGYTVVGACYGADSLSEEMRPSMVPHLGTIDEVRAICGAYGIDAVLVAGGRFTTSDDVRRIAWALEETEIDLIVAPNLTDIAGPRVHVRPVGGLPLLHVERPTAEESVRWGKRAFDVVGSLMLLTVALPVLFVVAVAVRLHDGGPVFFRQPRVGLRGQHFNCLKFRSMVPDAETMVASLAERNEADGVLFKIRHDPRITKLGRRLRRYSIDELPQLLNVLRGDMSLVGPRPPLPSEVARYDGSTDRRLLVRPGMTGLWQVSGRSTLNWQDSVRLDLYYVDNWSLAQDLVILSKTAKAVLTGHGAA